MSPGATSCASQIFSNIVFGIALAPSQAGGDNGEEARLAAIGVLEVVWKVGIERDAVTFFQVIGRAVADQAQAAAGDDCGFARARLVDRGVVRPAGRGARLEHVQRDLGALPR